jgi:hypothetical protein
MKKSILTLGLIMSLILSSCTAADTDSNSDDTTALQTVDMGTFTKEDLVYKYQGESYPLQSDAAPLLEALGPDYVETKAPSCAFIGEDKIFEYETIIIYTCPLDGIDMIDEIDVYQTDYMTSKGISIGDSLEDVKAAYGEGGFLEGSSYVYVLSGKIEELESPKLYFDLTDDNVTGIVYYAASSLQ